MNYLIKSLFYLILINTNVLANDLENNKILFKINKQVFTAIDLEERIDYITVTNNLNKKEIDSLQKKEILEDYLSSLLFYEHYIIEKIKIKNIDTETQTLFQENILSKLINKELSKKKLINLKSNLKKDIIRKKIIENIINLNSNQLTQEATVLDLLYNYNLSYITIKKNDLDKIKNINIRNRDDFNIFKKNLLDKKINFLFKNDDINESAKISDLIKKIIKQNKKIYFEKKNNYIVIISLEKKLESHEGIFVKLINFNTTKKLSKNDLKCNNIKNLDEVKQTVFKEYEYIMLNQQIKNSLISVNDYIILNNKSTNINIFNYIFLCEIRYDEILLNKINLNKKIDWLAKKIEINFTKNYKKKYNFDKNE